MSEATEGLHVDERRLAAILAADVAGYSRLMGRNEEETVRDLEAHQAVILPLIAKHGGSIVNIAGDGDRGAVPERRAGGRMRRRHPEDHGRAQLRRSRRASDAAAHRRQSRRHHPRRNPHIRRRDQCRGAARAARRARRHLHFGDGARGDLRQARPAVARYRREVAQEHRPAGPHLPDPGAGTRVRAATGWARVCANIAASRPRSGLSFSSPPSRASARGASGRARR